MLAPALATILGVAVASSGPAATIVERAAPRALALAVVAPPSITDRLLARTVAEAQAIWSTLGGRLEWHRERTAEHRHGEDLIVLFESRLPAKAGSDAALGWIVFAGSSPLPSIHLSRGGAEALMKTTTAPHATRADRETLLSRALGRALAHELGHYLMKSKGHTPRGLMRSAWRSQECFAADRRGFAIGVGIGRSAGR
jgi:hypothetical protein